MAHFFVQNFHPEVRFEKSYWRELLQEINVLLRNDGYEYFLLRNCTDEMFLVGDVTEPMKYNIYSFFTKK